MKASLCMLRSVSRQLFKSSKISVLEPGQPEYDRAIATSNRLFRFSRPDCVVQPETIDHVRTIVKEAVSKKVNLTIKCNGHSYAGHSTAFKGVSLDLRKMKNVDLDIKSKIVTMDAGCQWGHVYQTLINGGHEGYIINGGRCPTVGVSGFILGGGLGPFTRSFGMGCDTLKEATVVTATGDVVTVKDTDDPKSKEGELFWALQGGGGGNFGVLVRMKLKVQELENAYGTVVAGRYQWFPKPQEEKSDKEHCDNKPAIGGLSDEAISTMNDFYTTNWPNNITIDSTWICDLSQKTDGIRFLVAFDGSQNSYEKIIDKHIKDKELKTQLKRRVLPEPSTRFLYETLVNQWLEETERAYPTNKTYELFSSFCFKNDDRVHIEKVTAAIRHLMRRFRSKYQGEQVNFLVTWIHSGGKATEKKPEESAFFWREAVYHTYVTVEWTDKWMERDMRSFHAEVKRALRPLSLRGEASFINFPDGDFPRQMYERAYFGDNSEKLRRVKETWDKNGFFKFDQGVRLPNDTGDSSKGADTEDKTDILASNLWESFKYSANKDWESYKTTNLKRDLEMLEEDGF
ncbi:FAD-binding domain-containing protein [Trichoderma chlorosporum]